jgi:hypothetical protein
MQIDTTEPAVVSDLTRKTKDKYMKKKQVEFAMKFRNHKDPSYFDPNANDKIFVAKHMVNTTTLR